MKIETSTVLVLGKFKALQSKLYIPRYDAIQKAKKHHAPNYEVFARSLFTPKQQIPQIILFVQPHII